MYQMINQLSKINLSLLFHFNCLLLCNKLPKLSGLKCQYLSYDFVRCLGNNDRLDYINFQKIFKKSRRWITLGKKDVNRHFRKHDN